MNQPIKYDFFISYTSHDQAWAEWIAWQLEADGYRVILQAWDFRPGSDFIHQMDQAIQQAGRLVAVLSPAYLQSKFVEAEWRPFFAADPTGEKGLLVLVRVANVAPPALLTTRVYIDLTTQEDAALAKAALLEGIRPGPVKPVQEPTYPLSVTDLPRRTQEPRYPSVSPAIWNLSHRNPHFTGRRNQLEALRASLAESTTNSVQTQVVFGQPGVGKTQLTLEYGHRYASDYDLVWWIPAETAAAIPAVFADLAAKLQVLPGAGARAEQLADQQAIVDAVLDDLSHRTAWLLIFDHATDLDTLAPYLPTTGCGQVLITSRNPNWHQRVKSPLKVDILAQEEAAQFLLRRTGSTDEKGATELAEELGSLPLALEQAGAYMSRSSKPMSDYLGLFRRRRDELLKRGDPDGLTVDATVVLATDQIGSPAALGLLTWCAFMAPEKIPLYVLTESKERDLLPVEMRSMAQDEIELDENIAILYGSSLIARGDGVLDLHRLVQTVIRSHLPAAAYQAWADLTIRLLLESFPSSIDDLAAPSRWPRCEQLLSHIFVAAKHAEQAKVAMAETAELLMHLGSYLQHRGEYAEARNLFEEALSLAEAAHGRNDIRVAHVLNALGYVLRAQEDPAAAQAAHERALRIIKATLPPDDAEVGRTLNSLGRALYDQKDFPGARVNLERALVINEAAFGRDDPEVASTLNNLGRLFYEQGDLEKARTSHERALAIKEAAPAFGPDHPSVAVTLQCLGTVLLAQHDLDAARIALERARKLQETVLNEDHPDLQVTLELLVRVLEMMGDPKGGDIARERTQSISQARLGGRRRFRRSID